jgi:DNA-binding NtrC family response regulator
LVRFFEDSACPVYLLDDQRRIVFGNTALTEWVGLPLEQLMGARCDYCAGDDQTRQRVVTSALCPPPEAFQGARSTGRIYCPLPAGAPPHRRAEFLPVATAAADTCGVLAILSPSATPETDERGQADSVSVHALHELLQKLTAELRRPYCLDRLAGSSAAMARVREQIQLATSSQAHTVVLGPPGSHREQVARTIHAGSQPSAAEPLLPLSCPMMDAELLRTTVQAFQRRCDASDATPTILLLDADQLAMEGQMELLSWLRSATCRARLLATARQSLITLAEQKQYSRELAFRLSTLVIELPSLAERREDLPLLCQQLLEEHNARGGQQLSGFTAEALEALTSLPWLGNVRELADVVRDACARAAGTRITLQDLPDRVRTVNQTAAHPARQDEPIVLDQFLAEIEREVIQRALRRARGNKAQAARLLGVPRPRLLRRLTQLGLTEPRLTWRPSEPEEDS